MRFDGAIRKRFELKVRHRREPYVGWCMAFLAAHDVWKMGWVES